MTINIKQVTETVGSLYIYDDINGVGQVIFF